ncbi:hypothetical protein BDZ89DRAFT_890747, partial [Hymenopellis radicata]
ADDLVIISESRAGLQAHLDVLAGWFHANFLQSNADKSGVMVFGPLSKSMPRFTFQADEIPFKREEKYGGVILNSTLHNIFANHYKKKANVAQSSAHGGLFGLEYHVGRGNIPIRTSVQLYTALVDCHLIHGADVCPDVDLAALKQLE